MDLRQTEKDGLKTISLSGDFTVASAEETRGKLLEILSGKEPVRLELADVEEVDITGLQLLDGVLKYCEKNKIDVQCAFPGDGLWEETVSLSGYAGLSGEYRTKGVTK